MKKQDRVYDKEWKMYFYSEEERQEFRERIARAEKNIAEGRYRKFIIKNYIIIYSVNLKQREINILHIYNQKQKIKKRKLNKQLQEQNF